MSIRRTLITAAAAVAAVTVLAGCTGSGAVKADPAPTKSASATPSPTPAVPYPTQAPVPAPKTQQDAYVAANATINAYMALNSKIYADPHPGDAERFKGYEAAAALAEEEKEMKDAVDGGYYLSGATKWSPIASKTVFGSIGTGASKVDNGSVQLFGCFEYAPGSKSLAKPGHTAPPIPGAFPVSYTVSYFAVWKAWYITNYVGANGFTC